MRASDYQAQAFDAVCSAVREASSLFDPVLPTPPPFWEPNMAVVWVGDPWLEIDQAQDTWLRVTVHLIVGLNDWNHGVDRTLDDVLAVFNRLAEGVALPFGGRLFPDIADIAPTVEELPATQAKVMRTEIPLTRFELP